MEMLAFSPQPFSGQPRFELCKQDIFGVWLVPWLNLGAHPFSHANARARHGTVTFR
jgi:hypothetical protein